MKRSRVKRIQRFWGALGPKWLPFADAASEDLPLGRLLRLSLFQISVGMAAVLLTGTLNRVMILELSVPAWVVAVMVSLPLLFAPFRALIGFKSDTYKSYLGVRRLPYLWYGSLLQFGGLAIMPFALLVLSGDVQGGPQELGVVGAALAFLMVGLGMHTTQTAGLALATDISPADKRPRVVALLYVMLLVGMVASSIVFGFLLDEFTPKRLIELIQGAAVVTVVLNFIALWKQETRDPKKTAHDIQRPSFKECWTDFSAGGRATRLLVAIGLGTAGFSMQDILLEPYGGEILGLDVGQTTLLTALLAGGTLVGLALAARMLDRGADVHKLAALGGVIGIFAFSAVIFAAPMQSAMLFRAGTVMIGFGGGLFAVGTMTAAMALAREGYSGLALGAWGSVTATATGLAMAAGGAIRDGVNQLAMSGALGAGLQNPATGYSVVYHLEILFLFATLAAIGPLVNSRSERTDKPRTQFGLAEFPG
jgi:BCD family chlorophyll transporter-like MFS transporter